MSSTITTDSKSKDHVYVDDDGDDVPLPGFRFHPTDEELVGFYLRRKVEKKPIRIELIKHADIYKYDPWDLPKSSNNGDKEWYFFCKRGRKYKNSIRPNRVTGSGFWKATGIDKPVYSSNGEARSSHIIGLKKSLVYYRGSAGKGAKTEWMMHEFRLPSSANSHDKKISTNKPAIDQEAEVWTLCRILKREVSCNKRYVPDWREFAAKKRLTAGSINMNNPILDAAGSSETCSMESINCDGQSSYISFNNSTPSMVMTISRPDDHRQNCETKPYYGNVPIIANHQQSLSEVAQPTALFSSSACNDVNELLRHADWEELRNILDCAAAANPTNYYYPFCL